MNLKRIPATEISESPCCDRFSYELPEMIGDAQLKNAPVEVVLSNESKKYFIVRGLCIYATLVSNGENEILCNILSDVESDIDAFTQRTAFVLEDHRPFHILEQCMCIIECGKMLVDKDGGNSYYGIGGDRKSSNYKKNSILDRISERMPYKKSKIDILDRFGRVVGEIGIRGLHVILNERGMAITIHRIHKKNPELKKQNFPGQIESLRQQEHDEETLQHLVGEMVFNVLFNIETATEDKNEMRADAQSDTGDNNDSHIKNKRKSKAGESQPVKSDDESEDETQDIAQVVNPDLGPLSESGTQKVKSELTKCIDVMLGLQGFLETKNNLDENDAPTLDQFIKDLQTSFTNFVTSLFREASTD